MKRKEILAELERLGVDPNLPAMTFQLRKTLDTAIAQRNAEAAVHVALGEIGYAPVAKKGKRLGKYGGGS